MHKVALDVAHRIQTALMEPRSRFYGPVQTDDEMMGYANGVRANVIAGVDTFTRQAWAEPIYGPVNLSNSGFFIDRLVEYGTEIHTDSTKSYSQNLRPRQQVNHAKGEFARDCEKEGERVSTNLDWNFWSTFQEAPDRRGAVGVRYFPLYLAEHLWRNDH